MSSTTVYTMTITMPYRHCCSGLNAACLHPCADPETGAAHACGHNSQIAAVLGAAMGLAPLKGLLGGDVTFAAVPAEEYVELEFRQSLQEKGEIEFMGGKQEFVRLGVLEDVDMGLMIHSHAGVTERRFLLDCFSSGFIGKVIRFMGKEAHAGSRPFDGINALNAAALSLLAIGTQRETFREADRIRIHPIITKGGDLVNIVPADVRMETYVRGMSMEAILSASRMIRYCSFQSRSSLVRPKLRSVKAEARKPPGVYSPASLM